MAENNIAISVNSLTKVYNLDASYRATLSETIRDGIAALLGKKAKSVAEKKVAVDAVSFNIEQGKTVGVIGRNGSGKSTLLRILAGITEPTSGSIDIKGRVTSILDIGSGFIGDLTGYENVMMAGSLMGMDDAAIKQRMADIVSFSEIGDYIAMPVKYYSSGMYLRLAFSLAVHLDMDVLLIDEVIEVGDEAFKIKSYNKLKQLTSSGHTVLICTHNMRSVVELCDECLVMEKGRVVAQGHPQDMVTEYIEGIWGNSFELDHKIPLVYGEHNLISTSDEGRLKLLGFSFSQDGEEGKLFTDKPLKISFRYQKQTADNVVHPSIWVFDSNHRPVVSSNAMPWVPKTEPDAEGVYEVSVIFQAHFFNKGLFFLRLHLMKGNESIWYEYPQQFPFKMHLRHVDESNLKIDGKTGCPIYMELPWQKNKVE